MLLTYSFQSFLSKVSFFFFFISGDRGKETAEEDVDIDNDSSDEAFVPDWSVKRGTRMNHSSVCRDMMIHLATPVEEKYMDAYDADEAIKRGWLLLG